MNTAREAINSRIETAIGGKYAKAVQDRRTKKELTTRFLTDDIEQAIKIEQELAFETRARLINDLKLMSYNAEKSRSNLLEKLKTINTDLQKTKELSLNLSEKTKSLSKSFAEATEKLDLSTILVIRASEVRAIILIIQIFNKDCEMSKIINHLESNKKFPKSPYQRAEFINKLIKIVESAEGTEVLAKAKENLNEYKENLAGTLLDQFQKNVNDPSERAKCVQALVCLGADNSAIDSYIRSIPILGKPGLPYRFDINIFNNRTERISERYGKTCDYFVSECKVMWSDMDRIFENNQQAKVRLVQHVFQEIFKDFINQCLEKILMTYPDEFCSILCMMYKKTISMLDEIWKIDGQAFSATNILEDAFANYQTQYASREVINLASSVDNKIKPLLEQLKRIQEKAKTWKVLKKDNEEEDVFDIFNYSVPPTILVEGAAAWERCAILCPKDLLQDTLNTLINHVVQNTIREYLEVYLTTADICIEKGDIKAVCKFLAVTSHVSYILMTLEDKYKKVLKPILQGMKNDMDSRFSKDKDNMIHKIEKMVTNVLQKCIEIVVEKTKKIFNNKAHKNAFTGKNIALTPTNACVEFVQMMCGPNGKGGLIQQINESMTEADNRQSFCSSLGKELLEVITQNILSLKYDYPDGTILLRMDFQEYYAAFSKLNVENVKAKLEDLDKAINMMTMQGNFDDIAKKLEMPSESQKFAKKLLALRSDAKELNLESLNLR